MAEGEMTTDNRSPSREALAESLAFMAELEEAGLTENNRTVLRQASAALADRQPTTGAGAEKPVAFLKEWLNETMPCSRVDLHRSCETWLEDFKPTITPLYRHPTPPVDGSSRVAGEAIAKVEMVETEEAWPPGEAAEPTWRIEIGGYCADFEYEQAARNFADAINRAALSKPQVPAEGVEVSLFALEWISAARPPVHPEPMTGRQFFESFEAAVAFFARQPADATFVKLVETISREVDRSDDARAALSAQSPAPAEGVER